MEVLKYINTFETIVCVKTVSLAGLSNMRRYY